MGDTRPIGKVLKSQSIVKGAGVHLKRAFGHPQWKLLDPFLVLDDVHTDNLTRCFPWHPHRGIETITYMLHGEIDHLDSMGTGVANTAGGRFVAHHRKRHHPPGESKKGQLWPHAGNRTLGEPPRIPTLPDSPADRGPSLTRFRPHQKHARTTPPSTLNAAPFVADERGLHT